MADSFDELKELKANLDTVKERLDLEGRLRRGQWERQWEILNYHYQVRLRKRISAVNRYLQLTSLLFFAFLIGNWILIPAQWPTYSLFPFAILIGLVIYRASLIDVINLYANLAYEPSSEVSEEIQRLQFPHISSKKTYGEVDENGVPLL